MSEPNKTAQAALIATGVIAAFLYSNFILDWLISRDHFNTVVSDLEVSGAANATLLRVTDVVCAVLVLVLLPLVRRGLPPGPWREVAIWSTAAFAILAAVAAFVPLPCGEGESCPGTTEQFKTLVHDGSSIASDTLLFVGAGAIGIALWHTGPRWFFRAAWLEVVVGGIVASAAFGIFTMIDDESLATGLSQRFHILCISAWIVCLGIFAAYDGLRAPPDPKLPTDILGGSTHDRSA